MSLGMPSKRLGEVLIDKGLLKDWQLDLALEAQALSKKFLGEVLIEKGFVSQDALLRVLADQFSMPYTHLGSDAIDWSAAAKFSTGLQTGEPCLALAADDTSVTVAIANPLDAWSLSELERLAGTRRLRLVLAPAQEIRDAIKECHERARRSTAPPKDR